MRRRSAMRLGIALLALVTALAAASPPSSARSTLVIRLVSRTTDMRLIDRPPEGGSPGDKIVASSRLRNAVAQFGRPKGAVVGHDRGTFTLLSGGRTRLDGWVTLPGGKLHVRGIARETRSGSSFPVVGGTGDFASARGSVRVSPVGSKPEPALNVYRLTLP